MDLSLIIFIVIAAFFAYRGYKRGLLKSLSGVFSILAGYLAAIFYAKQVSVLIETQSQLQGIATIIIASIALFIGAGIAVSILFWLIKKLTPESVTVSVGSSVGGATVGLAFGVLIAIVIVWSFAFVRDMYAKEDIEAVKNTNSNTIEDIAGSVISKAVNSALSLGNAQPEVTSFTTAIIESPAEITKQLQRLSNSNDLQALLQDPQNQAVLNSGDIRALQELPAFQQLVKNPDFVALAKSAGMVDNSADNNQATDAALASQMTDIWRRVEHVKNDKRVQDILNDPEFQQKLQSGNPVDLLTNTRLLELADIVFSDSAIPDNSAIKETKPGALKVPKKETVIHSWVDNNGRIHFADEKQNP